MPASAESKRSPGYHTLSRFYQKAYKRHVAKGIGTVFPKSDESDWASD